jgi:predicted RNA-binding protein (virulence factor B family)
VIEIGKYNQLKILRDTSVGLYLGDPHGEDVLLPNKYCPAKFRIGDILDVFVYRDFAERIVATTLVPKIRLHEFALLKVSAVTDVGAFLDWGLEKELLVPFREQRQKMEKGRWFIVYLDIDKETDRLYASNKIERHLQNRVLSIEEGEEVDLIVYQKTDLGFSVIVNNQHKGLVFANEVFREIAIGDKMKGFVKKIREENKLDISIQPIGYLNYNDANAEAIYRALQNNNGFLAITEKNSPEKIYAHFGMSKKSFKKAIGALYKQRKIMILPNGIKLV